LYFHLIDCGKGEKIYRSYRLVVESRGAGDKTVMGGRKTFGIDKKAARGRVRLQGMKVTVFKEGCDGSELKREPRPEASTK